MKYFDVYYGMAKLILF